MPPLARVGRVCSALLRSALEKTLVANGYVKGSLKDRVDDAAKEGVITAARRLCGACEGHQPRWPRTNSQPTPSQR